MAFRVHPDGSIDADTPEDAIRLSRMLASSGETDAHAPPRGGIGLSGPRQGPVPPNNGARHGLVASLRAKAEVIEGSLSSSNWDAFTGLLNGKTSQLAALSFIRAERRTNINALRAHLKADSNYATSGVMAGIAKNLKKAGLDPAAVLKSERDENGVMSYTAGPMLVAAEDMGAN